MCLQNFISRVRREEAAYKMKAIDRIKLKWDYKELGGGCVPWTHLIQGRAWWWAIVHLIELYESY
jgi:hypothetical protein